MLKTGDIIYKVTLEGYDIPCVVVKKYKVGQRLSKIDGTEGGGYLLKLAVRADQYLYLGDYIEDSEQTFMADDYESIEQCIYDITNIKVKEKMKVGEIRSLCKSHYYQLIGARTGRKLANNWNNSQEILAKYDDCLTSGIFPSMKINTDIVNMPSYVFPIICIWVVDK